jgi:hypothetical protein
MRSETKFPILEDAMILRVPSLSAMELEMKARAYRARVVGELVAGAIVWIARLPRRLADSIEVGAPKQRV